MLAADGVQWQADWQWTRLWALVFHRRRGAGWLAGWATVAMVRVVMLHRVGRINI